MQQGIKHNLLSTKTSSHCAAQYLLGGRSVPKKVDTFSESSCRLLVFPPGRLYGGTPDIPDPDRYFLNQ